MKFWNRLMALVVVAAVTMVVAPERASAGPCDPASNPIVCENSKPGTPTADWYAPNAWGAIKGFTTRESVQPGDTLQFKVSAPVSYKIRIYRLGWYGGTGARLMPSSPSQTFGATNQPNCVTDSTGLTDCGNWSVSGSWAVPSDAVSGLYLAYLDQTDNNGVMPYPFVIRNEGSHSDIVLQTSDQTWQAYNMYGGRNMYQGTGPAPDGRAYKVSYNRPLDIAGDNGLFGSEYSMIAWFERNGYDISYLSGVDVSTKGPLLLNHKVFVSSGHDEYWNQPQFDNVVAARQAGVNLAFFSGNEVFWRTRLEASIDGANTADRTMVCYKMTKMAVNDGIADPSGTWTGTWMDPTGFATGAKPQNQLTGSIFRVNGYRSDAMTVPAAYGKFRLWRNTSIATLPAGQVATFPTGTLGYEWDVDEINATRPQGQISLSSTTLPINDGKLLLDNGNTYGNGPATHSLVEYRDQISGALVFGAGTVQWSWGLNTFHTGEPTTEDVRMQQATVNLLADMGVQPLTRQSTLVAATKSTDTAGPGITVTSPSNGATVPATAPVTISGTAADAGGGQVARVEVSTDGGTTWSAATGTTSWTFNWTPTAVGSAQIKVRAVDDSVNIGAVTTVSLTVGPQQCPCKIFTAVSSPVTVDAGDASAVETGVKFRTAAPGSISGVRFYKSPLNTGQHVGNLWSSTGQLLATGAFANETASGWQTLTFAAPVPVKPNTTYVASYLAPNGHYSADANYFTSRGAGVVPLQALQAGVDGGNGVYRYTSTGGFPSSSYNNTNYWVDAVLDTDQVSTTPPTVTSVTPAAGATGVAINTAVTATFSQAMDTDAVQFTVTGPGGAVPGSVSYDGVTRTATFQPGTQLGLGVAYTVVVQASDAWGQAMTSPRTWTFTTSSTPPPVTCPCSVWSTSTTPAVVTSGDPNPVEVGMRFSSAVNGYVNGVRFYKGGSNTGTHTGSLWSNTGQLLATGTFTNESATGWQTLTFAAPTAIIANTPYVVSYHAPNGQYSVNSGYLAAAHANYPLTALADGAAGANGLYRYGASGFPTGTYNSGNYWVDVEFATAGAAPAPAVSSTTPGAGATGVAITSRPTATFNVGIDAATLQFTLTGPGGTAVPGTTTYDGPTRTATFNPSSQFAVGTGYNASVRASDAFGTAMGAPHTWSFSTSSTPPPVTCPCSMWSTSTTPAIVTSGDPNAIELGTRFSSAIAGTVTGVRFYKGSANTGTHTGSLWSTGGVLLATGTFVNETASGWQTLTFPTPVAITANTTYVVSYHAPNGQYPVNQAYFTAAHTSYPLTAPASVSSAVNGLYSYGASAFPTSSFNAGNYWVDVVFI